MSKGIKQGFRKSGIMNNSHVNGIIIKTVRIINNQQFKKNNE